MGFSKDYLHIPEWKPKSEGYSAGSMVKYKGNIFYANFWASEPGIGDADHNGWRFYDELYDQTPHTPTEQAKIIAYIPIWRKGEGFDYANDEMYRYITHGIVSFLMFSEAELGKFTKESVNDVNTVLPDVVNTGHRNGTKILIALGGATDYGFLNLMTSIGNNLGSPLFESAVQKVVDFVNANDLDGVDLDLECWWDKNGNPRNDQGGRQEAERAHPAGYGLTEFAKRLKEAMPDKIVSAAFFASSWYGNNYELIDHVDWVGVMTYDLTGSWNNSPVGPHTALFEIRDQSIYLEEQQGSWPLPNPESPSEDPMRDNPIQSVEKALWYWTNPLFINWQGGGQKMSREKLVGGVPLYGYDFARGKDDEDREKDEEGKPIGPIPPGYKTIRYKDILNQFSNAHKAENANIKVLGSRQRPDFVKKVPGNYQYTHNIYYETPDTAVAKLNFLKSVGAQGVIIWELSNEVWEEGKSIIKALYRNSGNPEKPWFANEPPPNQEDSIVGNGFFPSIAVNDKGVVVQTFIDMDSDTLFSRVGKHTDKGVVFASRQQVADASGYGHTESSARQTAVAINSKGYVVVVFLGSLLDEDHNPSDMGDHSELLYRMGKVEDYSIVWLSDIEKYDIGVNPSIALSNENIFFEVHQGGSTDKNHGLHYHVGRIENDNLKLGPSIWYDDGKYPSIATTTLVSGQNVLVEVHSSNSSFSDELWCRLGILEEQSINWAGSISQKDIGIASSVAINADGWIVEVHKATISENGLKYKVGQLNKEAWNIRWATASTKYANGNQPTISLAGSEENHIFVETHRLDYADYQISSLASIPRVHRFLKEFVHETISFETRIGVDLESHGVLLTTGVDEIDLVEIPIPYSYLERKWKEFEILMIFVPIIPNVVTILENSIKCDVEGGESEACKRLPGDVSLLAIEVMPGGKVVSSTVKNAIGLFAGIVEADWSVLLDQEKEDALNKRFGPMADWFNRNRGRFDDILITDTSRSV